MEYVAKYIIHIFKQGTTLDPLYLQLERKTAQS